MPTCFAGAQDADLESAREALINALTQRRPDAVEAAGRHHHVVDEDDQRLDIETDARRSRRCGATVLPGGVTAGAIDERDVPEFDAFAVPCSPPNTRALPISPSSVPLSE